MGTKQKAEATHGAAPSPLASQSGTDKCVAGKGKGHRPNFKHALISSCRWIRPLLRSRKSTCASLYLVITSTNLRERTECCGDKVKGHEPPEGEGDGRSTTDRTPPPHSLLYGSTGLGKKAQLFFFLVTAAPSAYGSSPALSETGAASLWHSHSHRGSKLHLGPTPQLMAKARSLTH